MKKTLTRIKKRHGVVVGLYWSIEGIEGVVRYGVRVEISRGRVDHPFAEKRGGEKKVVKITTRVFACFA